MKIEHLDISQVKPNPKNPRTITSEKLKSLVRSIKDFPQMLELRPLVVDKKGVVIGGNMRLAAAKDAGLKKIPVMRAESLTPAQVKEFIIKDNVGFGEWDWDALANEWDVQKLEEWGLDLPDFENNKDAKEDDYEIPDRISHDIKHGDMLKIGSHELICGDATESKLYAKFTMRNNVIAFTSPPYNVGSSAKIQGSNESRRGSKYISTNDNLSNDEYARLLQNALDISLHNCDGAVICCQPLAANKKIIHQFLSSNLNRYNDLLIWDKGSGAPQMARNVLTNRFEWLCVFSKTNNSRTIPLASWKGTVSNVVSISPQRTNDYADIHNATFPVALPVFVLSELCNQSAGVLDQFMGTGTTMVAAHQLGRKAYGVEIDPHYCAVIVDRMLKLDPSLTVTKNGEPYKTGG